MISLDDVRWSNMTAGYRIPFDPRPLLNRLETESDIKKVWKELWTELHHQGDVGEASFAAVPFLVRSYRNRGVPDWNTYTMVAIIELARNKGQNPDVPRWMADDYFQAVGELAEIGAKEVLQAKSDELVRSILGFIAIQKGLRVHGEFLVSYSEDEMRDFESRV